MNLGTNGYENLWKIIGKIKDKVISHKNPLRIDTRQTKVLEVKMSVREKTSDIFFSENGKKFSYRRIAGKGENN